MDWDTFWTAFWVVMAMQIIYWVSRNARASEEVAKRAKDKK